MATQGHLSNILSCTYCANFFRWTNEVRVVSGRFPTVNRWCRVHFGVVASDLVKNAELHEFLGDSGQENVVMASRPKIYRDV